MNIKYAHLARLLIFSLLLTLPLSIMAKETHRSERYTSRSNKQASQWQHKVRAQLFSVLQLQDLVAEKTPIPFQAKVILSEDRGDYTWKELEINSTPARRIKIVLTIPKTKKSASAVVCVHGHSHDRYSTYDPESIYKGFATSLAKSGYVTIAANVGQHEVYEKDRILMGERLWDLIRCVDYLETLPEVNKNKIGCAGLSLGGEMTMWLGAMDERIAATVSAGFLTIMDQMEQNHCMCWKFDGLRELVDYADIYSLHAPRPLQCQNGLKEGPKDFYVPIARKALQEIKLIYNDFGHPNLVTLDVHPGGHEIDLDALLNFFKKYLKNTK